MSKVTEKNMKSPPPTKQKDIRDRKFLTPKEIDEIILRARKIGRHGHRDGTMILICYRHALRVSELVNLKWSQVNLKESLIHVKRLKNGINTSHPLTSKEIRGLRKIKRDYPHTHYVFISEHKNPTTTSNFRRILKRAGEKAKIHFSINPHMLRHSTGFKLANDKRPTRTIQVYMGHQDIKNTAKYTAINPDQFKDLWDD